MILLDSDHLTVLRYPESKAHGLLRDRMRLSTDHAFATTIVSVEEQMRGWLADIHRRRVVHDQIAAYERLLRMIEFFSAWEIIPLDSHAADVFVTLRKQRARVGTQDMKIAAIALANNALLLSANLRDFRRVLGLRVENWLE